MFARNATTLFFYKPNVYKHISWDSFKSKHKLSISLGWKIRKYLPTIIKILFSNFKNFIKVNTLKISLNALIAQNKHIQEKVKTFKIDIKSNYYKNQLDKHLRVKINKILRHQTFMYLRLCSCRFYYSKAIVS